ncbi:MAG TPA: hypothetical protein QF644_00340 [Candidatus Poseidoniaceae archaeon]|nr:hypothetical protein [Candidatus Poseidoniaceae archaeon]
MNDEICDYRDKLYFLNERRESLDYKIYEINEISAKMKSLLRERGDLEKEIAYLSEKIDKITQKMNAQKELNEFEGEEE